jgi:hypothetical protein
LVKCQLVASRWNNVSKWDKETNVQEVRIGTKRVVGAQGLVGHKKGATVPDPLGVACALVSEPKCGHLEQGQESEDRLKIYPEQLAQTIFSQSTVDGLLKPV